MRTMTFEEAKRLYVNRFTMEHVPNWACGKGPEGTDWLYAPQYRTDREWFDNTLFPPNNPYANDGSCFSSGQTWPLGLRLTSPYVEGRQ